MMRSEDAAEDPMVPILPGASTGGQGELSSPREASGGASEPPGRGQITKTKSILKTSGLTTRVDANGDEYVVLSEFAVRRSADFHERTGGASALQYRRNTKEPWYAAPPPWALNVPSDRGVPAVPSNAGASPSAGTATAQGKGPSRASVDGMRSTFSLLKNMPREPKWQPKALHTIRSTGRSTFQSLQSTMSGISDSGRGLAPGGWLPWRSRRSHDGGHDKLSHATSMALRDISTRWNRLAGPPSDEARRQMPNPVADMALESNFGSKRMGSVPYHKKPGRHIIHPLSQFRKIWDIALIFMFLISATIVPFYISFWWEAIDEHILRGERQSSPTLWLGVLKDTFFLLDMVVVFNSGYVRKHDFIAIMDRRMIVRRYLKSWFLTDLLTSLPVTLFSLATTSLQGNQILRALEVILASLRLNRVLRAVARVKNHFMVPVFQARIAQWTFVAVLFLHWNSCVQYLVAVATGFPEGCWVAVLGLQERSIFMQYIWSVYNASSQMLAIGYGPVDPTIDQEVIVVMVSFTLSTMLFPVLISIITTSLISMDSLRQQYQTKLQSWDQYMAHRRMPLELRERIRGAMDYRWRTRRAVDEEDMIGDLPIALQLEVRLDMCAALIQQVPIFKGAPLGFINSLVVFLKLEIYMEGDYIIREATIGKEMFFIHSGVVEVLHGETLVEHLGKGAYFGEIAVLQAVTRSASCRAVTHCEVSVLGKEDLDLLLQEYPSMAEVVNDVARDRLIQTISRISFGNCSSQDAEADGSGSAQVAELLEPMPEALPKSAFSSNGRSTSANRVFSFASRSTAAIPPRAGSSGQLPV